MVQQLESSMLAPHKALLHSAFSISQIMNILFSVIIDNYKQSGQEATVYAQVYMPLSYACMLGMISQKGMGMQVNLSSQLHMHKR